MTRELSGATRGVLSYFTRHRTAANLLLVLMMVLGLASTTQIRSQFFPDIIVDRVTVSVKWQGAGPEYVDNGIVAVLEPALLAVEGIESSESSATQGRARILLEFEPGWDMARAADDVKVAVDAVSGLPDGADDPKRGFKILGNKIHPKTKVFPGILLNECKDLLEKFFISRRNLN